MTTEKVGSSGSRPLAKFEIVVQQNEGIFGPLVSLSSQGTDNVIELEIGNKPQNRAVLATFIGDSAPEKSGHTLVCKGDCLVDGNPAKVAAYRKQ